MQRTQDTFQGVFPRTSPRLLPANAGQDATNARLLSGDLEAWRQFALTHQLAQSAPILSIYLLNGAWLSWQHDADAVRGPVPGDTTFRLFITDPTDYSTPVWTNYDMATSGTAGHEPYPMNVRPLGVPAPQSSPFNITYTPVTGSDPFAVTAYVYTYVNDIGEESAPGLAAVSLASPRGTPNPLSIPTPTGQGDANLVHINQNLESGYDAYNVVAARLYRAATGASGTIYRFVAEILMNDPLGHPFGYSYNDTLSDFQLGEELPSSLWDLPMADAQGMLALPNGVMSNFQGNILGLSAQNHPHAWPVEYQLTTDTDIVGTANIDTTIVVWTKSFPYVASGVDPSQYAMSKFEFARACVSKRSVTFLRNVGVVGATALGLEAIQGPNQIINLTDGLFTYQQWQALNPSSILCVVHNNILFFFYDTGSVKGGYALDPNPNGGGLVPLGFHATAAYNDPLTDKLYLVLDFVSEPTDPNLPLGSTAPTPDSHTIYEFDSPSGSGSMVYKYRGKLSLLERPAVFQFAQMKAQDFTNIVLNLYADDVQIYGGAIDNTTEFRVPAAGSGDQYQSIEWEFIGTSRIRSLQLAETIDELGLVPASLQFNAT
jgi:hypothetical protein